MGQKVVRAAIAGGVAATWYTVSEVSTHVDQLFSLLVFIVVFAAAIWAENHIT